MLMMERVEIDMCVCVYVSIPLYTVMYTDIFSYKFVSVCAVYTP